MNVEEKVATLEALLDRVKKNAALPRPAHRTDEMGAAPWTAAVARIAPAVSAASGKAEAAAKAEAVLEKAETVKIAAVKAEVAPARDAWLDELSALVPEQDGARPPTPPAPAVHEEKPAAAAKPAPTPKPAEVAATKAPRPVAPQLTKKADAGPDKISPIATGSALPKVTPAAASGSAPEKIAATATGSALPKISPAATGSALPKISPTATGSALPRVSPDKIAPTATGSALPKVTAKPAAEKIAPTATGSALPKVSPEKIALAATGAKAKPPEAKPVVADELSVDEPTHLFAPPQVSLSELKEEPHIEEQTKIAPPALKAELVAASKEHVAADEPSVDEATQLMAAPRASVPDADAKPAGDQGTSPAPAAATEKVVIKTSPAAEVAAPVEAAALPEPPPVELPPVKEARPIEAAPAAAALADEGAPAPAIDDKPAPEPIHLEPEITSPSRRYMPPPEPEVAAGVPRPRSKLGVALVAVLLAAAGTYLGFRNGWFGGTTETPPAPTTAPTTQATVGVAPPLPPTTVAQTAAPVTPTPTASAIASATPSASAGTAPTAPTASASAHATAGPAVPSAVPSAAPAADGDGSNLPATRAYLVVDSPTPQAVYNGGVFVGLTGQKLELECGIKYLRLGVPPENGVARPNSIVWTSEGKSANLVCKATTRVSITPTR